MRRSFWIVLGLVGAFPLGALAQEGQQPAGQASVPPDADIYMGWVRAVTGDRLLLEERTGNIYELGIDETTRLLGYQGRSVSSQALQEGTFVRAAATEGEERDQVRRIDILAPPVPER